MLGGLGCAGWLSCAGWFGLCWVVGLRWVVRFEDHRFGRLGHHGTVAKTACNVKTEHPDCAKTADDDITKSIAFSVAREFQFLCSSILPGVRL